MIPPFALTLLAGLSVLSATIPVVSGFTPPDFGYTNLLSALNWQNLNVTAYSACAEGLIQSPIDLNDTIAFASQNPLVHIPPLNKAVLQNTGVLVEIVYPTGFGLTVYNGTTWQIDNFHFHAPGEHRVYQEFFPVEMHIVNSDVKNSASKLVLTALMELSESSPLEFMEIIYEGLDKIPHPGDNTTLSKPIDIDPVAEVLSDNKTFNYAYIGSLTQPPCTEGVSWVIPTTTFPITICQFNALKKVLRFNSRYTQNTLKDGNLLQIGCGH